MSSPRATIPLKALVSVFFTLLLAGLGLSCGPAEPEVDKAALYTPESLASELALRYRQLNPDAKAAAVRFQLKPRDAKRLEEQRARSEQAKNKVLGGPPAKKKQTGPPTVDGLLADLDSKLDLIKGVSRADACRKMVEAISSDASLSESEKQRLTEFVSQLDGSR
jgi:hypothetical protein